MNNSVTIESFLNLIENYAEARVHLSHLISQSASDEEKQVARHTCKDLKSKISEIVGQQSIEKGCKLSMSQVFDLIRQERARQDTKWGTIAEKQQSCAGYILVMENEMDEAREGWNKNKTGRHSALSEIIQVAAVAVACLQQHGNEGN